VSVEVVLNRSESHRRAATSSNPKPAGTQMQTLTGTFVLDTRQTVTPQI